MNNYTASIHFKHVGTTVWSLNGPFSEEFVVGFLYGGLVSKHMINADYNYHFEFYAQRTTSSFSTLNALMRRFLVYFVTYARSYEIDKRITRTGAQWNEYSMWLRFYNPETPQGPSSAWLARFRTPQFLQGLLTVLQAFNVPIAAVILTAPIKDNVSYTINGEILPDPNEYTDEVQQARQAIIEADRRAAELEELEEDREYREALGGLELVD